MLVVSTAVYHFGSLKTSAPSAKVWCLCNLEELIRKPLLSFIMAESGMNYELFCIGFVLGSLYMDAKEDMINETNVLLREEKPNLKGSSNILVM